MRLCFYTGDPPLRDHAYGNHGVARHFINILRDEDPVVLTQLKRRSIQTEEIKDICGSLDLWLHPSVSALGLARFFPAVAALLDALIFAAWLPFLSHRLSKAGIERIFILCGADALFLLHVWLIQKTGIPVDIYLVDDIKDSCERGVYRIIKPWVAPFLRKVLENSARTFAISPGFAGQNSIQIGVPTTWLPLPYPEFPELSSEHVKLNGPNRHIVFIGAINRLYVQSIRDLYDEICQYNANENRDHKLILEIITYGSTTPLFASLPNRDWVVGFEKLPDEELQRHLAEAYTCFLPYSFSPEERLMVSTSFSCKILEYFQSRRPILVYGPDYASIPRYFKELGLPLCATSREELRKTLGQIAEHDSKELIEQYQSAWRCHHSPAAIRAILLSPARDAS